MKNNPWFLCLILIFFFFSISGQTIDRILRISSPGVDSYNKPDWEHPFFEENHIVYKLPKYDSYKSAEAITLEVERAISRYFENNPSSTNFEIRLLTDMNKFSYMFGWFGFQRSSEDDYKAAMKGVYNATNKLNIKLEGHVGSNDARMMVNAIDELYKEGMKSPFSHLIFDDGQVTISEFMKIIPLVGENKISIFTYKGGFDGSLRPQYHLIPQIGIISDIAHVNNLKMKFPNLNTYHIDIPGFDLPFDISIINYQSRHSNAFWNPHGDLHVKNPYPPLFKTRIYPIINFRISPIFSNQKISLTSIRNQWIVDSFKNIKAHTATNQENNTTNQAINLSSLEKKINYYQNNLVLEDNIYMPFIFNYRSPPPLLIQKASKSIATKGVQMKMIIDSSSFRKNSTLKIK